MNILSYIIFLIIFLISAYIGVKLAKFFLIKRSRSLNFEDELKRIVEEWKRRKKEVI